MAMKIDQMFPSHALTGRRNQTSNDSRPETATKGKTDAHATAGDRVTLTKGAHNLTGLINSANDMSEASIERVEKLRGAINSGNYQINSDKIARKIMESEFGL